MSIFGSMVSKIFGDREATAARPGAQQAEAASTAQQSASVPAGQPPPPAASAQGTAEASTAPRQQQPVDVAAVLTDMAAKHPQKLDWRHSIVDSAAMNKWLHKQVMRKLAENGGKVPDELRS
jgi:hypothetical protein